MLYLRHVRVFFVFAFGFKCRKSRKTPAQANRAALAELRAFQERVRLEDDIAAEAVKEAVRAHLEEVLEKGIECTKRRTRMRDYSDAVKVRRRAPDWPHKSTSCPTASQVVPQCRTRRTRVRNTAAPSGRTGWPARTSCLSLIVGPGGNGNGNN